MARDALNPDHVGWGKQDMMALEFPGFLRICPARGFKGITLGEQGEPFRDIYSRARGYLGSHWGVRSSTSMRRGSRVMSIMVSIELFCKEVEERSSRLG